MTKKTIYTTAQGTAQYPHLRVPESYEGQEIGYTIKLLMSQENTAKFKLFLEKELAKAAESPEFKGKSFAGANMGLSTDKDGNEVFKFKTKATFQNRNGETFKKTLSIFDAFGKPVPEEINVGHGSIVKVAFSTKAYWKNRNMKGLTLYLEAVQVIELKEGFGGASADEFGFGAVEGGFSIANAEAENCNPLEETGGMIDATADADF